VQLDLFAHSRDVMLRNDVIAALRGRDAVAGRERLAVLRAEYPEDALLAPATVLLESMSAPHQRFADHDAAAGALRAMEAAVSCAERVFGSEEALAWLAPAWTSLAHAAAELPYRAAGAPR
jgi:hypothetical protein